MYVITHSDSAISELSLACRPLLTNSYCQDHTLLGERFKNPHLVEVSDTMQSLFTLLLFTLARPPHTKKKAQLSAFFIRLLTSLSFERQKYRSINVCSHFAPQTLHFIGSIIFLEDKRLHSVLSSRGCISVSARATAARGTVTSAHTLKPLGTCQAFRPTFCLSVRRLSTTLARVWRRRFGKPFFLRRKLYHERPKCSLLRRAWG